MTFKWDHKKAYVYFIDVTSTGKRPNFFLFFAPTTNQHVLQQKQLKLMYVQQQIQWLSQRNLKLHQQYSPQWQAMLQGPLLQVF